MIKFESFYFYCIYFSQFFYRQYNLILMPTNKRLKRARKTINQLQYALLSQESCICQMHKKTASLQQQLIDQAYQTGLIKDQLVKTTNNYQNLTSKYTSLQQRTTHLQKLISQMANKNKFDQTAQKQNEDSIKRKIIRNETKINQIVQRQNIAVLKQQNLSEKQFILEKEVSQLKKVTQELKPVKIVQEPPKKSSLFGSSSQGLSGLFGQAKPISKQTNSYASYGGCPHFVNGGTCRNCL